MKRIFLLAFFLVLPIHSFARLQESNFILISESLYEGVLYKIKIDENFITKDDNKIGWILRDKIKCGKKDKYCVDKTRLEVNCKSGRAKILDIIDEKNTKVVNRKSFNDENWFSIESAASVAGMAFNFFCGDWIAYEVDAGTAKYDLNSVTGNTIKSFSFILHERCTDKYPDCPEDKEIVRYDILEVDCVNKKSRAIVEAITTPMKDSYYWEESFGSIKDSKLGMWQDGLGHLGKVICTKPNNG